MNDETASASCAFRALFDKRIPNRQLLDRLPMMQVLGIEDGATGSQRSGNNQAVVDRKTAIACDFDCRFVLMTPPPASKASAVSFRGSFELNA